MKLLNSRLAAVIAGVALFDIAEAWGKEYHHNPHSVHAGKTSHRAKTMYISQSLLDSSADKDGSGGLATKVETYRPTEIATFTKGKPKATCAHIASGATDTPAIREPGTTVIFRENCGITDETAHECPFLCGPGGQGSIKACFSEDVSRFIPNGDGICIHCLAPCKATSTKHHIPTAKPSITSKPSPSCTSVELGAVDSPAATDAGTGLLFRRGCGLSKDTVDACPYLCGRGEFKQCSGVDFSGSGPNGFPPAMCKKCLFACKDHGKDHDKDPYVTGKPEPTPTDGNKDADKKDKDQ